MMKYRLSSTDGLLVVDVQYDFLEEGALAVPGSNRVLPVIKKYLHLFAAKSLLVVASRDWHPESHCSFAENGGPWPVHCVAGTSGAAFHKDLVYPENHLVVSKATDPTRDAYSAFDGTELGEILSDKGIKRLFICGLATDYCVLYSVKDAINNGFKVVVLNDGIAAVNVNEGDGDRAVEEMEKLGAEFIEYGDMQS